MKLDTKLNLATPKITIAQPTIKVTQNTTVGTNVPLNVQPVQSIASPVVNPTPTPANINVQTPSVTINAQTQSSDDKSKNKTDDKSKNKTDDKSKNKTSKSTNSVFPIDVFAYGRKIFTVQAAECKEKKQSVVEEYIRKKAETEYQLFEMSKETTRFVYSNDKHKISLQPKFKNKG